MKIMVIEDGTSTSQPKDRYEAVFGVGQLAAKIAVESKNSLDAFTKIRGLGIKSLVTETTQIARTIKSWAK